MLHRKVKRHLLLGLLFKFVRTENTNTVGSLSLGKTGIGTLEELIDLLHNNVLNINLVLVVQVGSSELNL